MNGDTIALMFDRGFTREQFDAAVAVLWASYPEGIPDGASMTLPGGLEVTVKVEKNP